MSHYIASQALEFIFSFITVFHNNNESIKSNISGVGPKPSGLLLEYDNFQVSWTFSSEF